MAVGEAPVSINWHLYSATLGMRQCTDSVGGSKDSFESSARARPSRFGFAQTEKVPEQLDSLAVPGLNLSKEREKRR